MSDAPKAVLRGKFITLIVYIKKIKTKRINDQTSTLRNYKKKRNLNQGKSEEGI